MLNLWNNQEIKDFAHDPLALRVYSSRLLGKEPSLVLHGGGNTSVKIEEKNIFGEIEKLLYVKGSGWDLATIQKQGFAPVRMDTLLRVAQLETLSDSQMVRLQRAAMTNPDAPNPSVEAILHAIIPFKYVDHTHADTVIAISNTPNGDEKLKEIYKNRVIYIPYVMPGFILARKVFELTRDLNWNKYEGMILLHHGVFTFGDDAQTSYERMINLVTTAEEYLKTKKIFSTPKQTSQNTSLKSTDYLALAKLRKLVSNVLASPVIAKLDSSAEAIYFSQLDNLKSIATRGPLTPDHVLHTKPFPVILNNDFEQDVFNFSNNYKDYFNRNTNGQLSCLDSVPRLAIWPGLGCVAFGLTVERARIVSDIYSHTIQSIQWAEKLGGWKALPEKDIFDVEYWELEQAKLKKKGAKTPSLQGKIALVTGAASGIGKACVEALLNEGAAVAALDINPNVTEIFAKALGMVCDVTKPEALKEAIEKTVKTYGGLDIVITNAGTFPPGKNISELEISTWESTLKTNLHSHFYLLHTCIPYLTLGIDPAIVVIASKNVPAPGPGASAYSTAKAGLTQLARVAALELGPKGIRVNVIHPNAVFDTGIWTEEVLQNRAAHYNMSLEEYKKNNILKTEVTSKDVATLACAMAGPVFFKTTGAQVPVDGGNDRVI